MPKILILDDDPARADAIRDVLAVAGYAVETKIERAVSAECVDPTSSLDGVRSPVSPVMLLIDDPQHLIPLREVERWYVSRVLAAVAGNKSTAARILGIDRKTLYRKVGASGSSNEA